MYLILSIVTGIYLILSSVRDLKERMIYSFPAVVLALAWGIYSVELYENEYGFLLGAWVATVVLWFLFKRFSIWGEGDNDVFLLFAGVLLCTLRFRKEEVIYLDTTYHQFASPDTHSYFDVYYDINQTEDVVDYYLIITKDFAGNQTKKKLTSQRTLLTMFRTSIDRGAY